MDLRQDLSSEHLNPCRDQQPGFFMTEQLRFLHIDPATGELLPRARQVIAHTPMGRYGQPEDLFGALVWLLSDASSFVSFATSNV